MSDGYIFTKPINKQQGCTVDYSYLEGKNYEEVQNNWPDNDWNPIPKDEEEYWKVIEGYVDLRKRYSME